MDTSLARRTNHHPSRVEVSLMGRKARLQLGDAYHILHISERAMIAAPGLACPFPIDPRCQGRVLERAAERFLQLGSFYINPSWIGWASFAPDRLTLGGAAGKYPGKAATPEETEIIVRSCGLVAVNDQDMVNPELAAFYDPGTATVFACGQGLPLGPERAARWIAAMTATDWIGLPGGRMANPRQAMMIEDTTVTYTPGFSHEMRDTDEAGRAAIGAGSWAAIDIRLSVNLDGLRKISRCTDDSPWKRSGAVTLANGCRARIRSDQMRRLTDPARLLYPHLQIERHPLQG